MKFGRRIKGEGPISRRAIRVAVLIPALAITTCIPAQIPSVPEAPEPFVRYPYLQAVSDSSAYVLWTTSVPLQDTLVYWIEETGGAVRGDIGGGGAGRGDTVRADAGPREAGRGDTVRVASSEAERRRRVRLDSLPSDSRIGYRLITGPPRRVTEDHHFRTAPRPGARKEVTALVFGDSGTGSRPQVDLARRMEERDADLILHTGDVVYPEGSETDLTQRHFRVYRELLARTPFFPTVGNHDVRTRRGRPFGRAFVLPGRPDSSGRYYYSFDWGRVHFIGLDSTGEEDEDIESNLRLPGEQQRWLANDLAEAAGDPRIDWIVVYFHHPPYSSARGLLGHASDVELRRALVPFFDRYGVDLVLTGHDHHYERSHPLRADSVDRQTPGTVYVVTGGGGGRLEWRGVGETDFAATSSLSFHYVVLRMDGERLILEAFDREDERIDRARIRAVPADSAVLRRGSDRLPGGS